MLVLKILGILVALFVLAVLVLSINKHTDRKYDYEFFSFGTYGVSAAGYVMIYYGYRWYESALSKNLDILNGQIIIGLGIILILGVVYYNVKKTSFSIAIIWSIFQQLLYAVFAIVGLLALLGIVMYFMQTKPVLNINER